MSARLVYETDTSYGHYEIWDLLYGGRPARVLYSGHRQAAQSGMPLDANPELLFDYNQRFYELVSGSLPARVLLIGGGSYTLPKALINSLPTLQLDVVELDGELEALASQYFGLQANPRLRIINQDGRQFLESTQQLYDMILVDAFSHTDAPDSLTDAAAVQVYRYHLKPNGVVGVNTIAPFYGPGAANLKLQLASYKKVFKNVAIFPASHDLSLWSSQNLLLVAQAGKIHPVGEYLRYPALDLTAEHFVTADRRV